MNNDITDAMVADIKRVARRLGANSLSRSEYFQHGKYSQYQLYDGGNDWTTLCKRAGVTPKTKQPVSDENYFLNLAKTVKALGRYPRASERKKFGLNFSKRRFPTLTAFIEKAIELGHVPDLRKPRRKPDPSESYSSPEAVQPIRPLLQSQDDQARPVPPIPLDSRRSRWKRTGLDGFPYAPQEEQGVLALFSILCDRGVIPWQIIDLSTNGIDAICFDETNKKEIRVELKYLLSKGSWNHRIEDLDYVVCWEKRWPDFPKPVIELAKLMKKCQRSLKRGQ